MRAQIHRNEIRSIWLNIGLLLIISDLLLIISIASDVAYIEATVTEDLICIGNGPTWIYIWYGINDLIIGIYCLLAFILPLMNYVKLENELNLSNRSLNFNDIQIGTKKIASSVKSIVQKIIIYNSIALISTMIFTFYAMAINEKSVGKRYILCFQITTHIYISNIFFFIYILSESFSTCICIYVYVYEHISIKEWDLIFNE